MLALSDLLIDEMLSTDIIVRGIPMHNFSVPATFKAWIDQIVSYTDQAQKGLIPSDRKVIAIHTFARSWAGQVLRR
jgi:FMN-dependent NADH-azoreductase